MAKPTLFRQHQEPADHERGRQRMVEKQLRQRGIHDQRVLDAMGRVPRHAFVPPELADAAYADSALPLADHQTISQPFTVAFMCQAAQLAGHERVLEVGTGSGYGAAVLSELAHHVDTVERLPELAEQARQTLARCGYRNVDVHLANGTFGLPGEAKFDAIVVTAGAASLPRPFWEQLVEGGRIVIPIGETSDGQTMFRFTLDGDELVVEDLGKFAFVPLIGEYGWDE